MKRIYNFSGEDPLLFDDTKTVKELIMYAFDQFGYYEPAGMEIVTIFQPQSFTNYGWFTTNTTHLCADEIVKYEYLCFAYHMPNVFYFAEGGWGHHMLHLGNHPQIDNPVLLSLRFDDFHNSVVINGAYTFEDVIGFLKDTGYLSKEASSLLVCAVNPYQEPYRISFDNGLMHVPLTEFEKKLPESVVYIDIR